MAKPLRFPKTLGECIDLAYKLEKGRIERQREVEAEISEMKQQEQALEDHIINSFDKADIEGAKGSIASASITRSIYPKVNDWTAVWAYIRATGEFDLLEKRLAKAAFRERLDHGVNVPGTEAFEKLGLSLTKIKK